MRNKRVFLGIAGAAAFILLLTGLAYYALRISIAQSFSSPTLLVVQSPSLPENAFWLVTDGFQDRGITLYLESASENGASPVRIVDLDWDSLYHFSMFHWTRDGEVGVFTVRLSDGSEVRAFAHDFSRELSVLPPWMGVSSMSASTIEEWREHEVQILDLVEAHGGLDPDPIDLEHVRAHSQGIWIWQVPGR